jgi:hypothetical protein
LGFRILSASIFMPHPNRTFIYLPIPIYEINNLSFIKLN